ncbi:MAG: DUF1697 domain-containing protein [Vallitaleaceae bacterium]|nr:DUF1697 domain-containing protein [Vallitaleaceae bacterium]
MDNQYCVFLRGINVNGIKITMQDLKKMFEGMGFTNVQTVLATGNVLLTVPESSGSRDAIKSAIENELSTQFHYEAHVIIRELSEILAVCSLARTYTISEDYHHYLLLCEGTELPLELSELFITLKHAPGEQFIVANKDALWIVPKGDTLNSEFGSKVLGSKKYKSKLTSRNMNTIEKMANL